MKKEYLIRPTAGSVAVEPPKKPTEYPVTCFCGSPMTLRWSSKGFKHGWFYGCSRYPECDGTHGCHGDGKPLGTPADKPTKASRMWAHKKFDSLWKSGYMSRRGAYSWMQKVMGLTPDQAHIAMMNTLQCQSLMRAVDEFLKEHSRVV